jgi:tRNA A-37 threonylcarbamoyl transferase component Bud32
MELIMKTQTFAVGKEICPILHTYVKGFLGIYRPGPQVPPSWGDGVSAVNEYLAIRSNGIDADAPRRQFPRDGEYSWETSRPDPDHAKVRYDAGLGDRAWMEERDHNYVFRLEREGRLEREEPNLIHEVPKLYQEIMAYRLKQAQVRLDEEKAVGTAHLTTETNLEIIPAEQLRYDSQHSLGEGTFGVVYRGTWTATGREVAIKQMKMQQLSEKNLRELKKEAAIMAGLKDSNITILYGLCLDPGKVSLVMEYFPKLSLFHLLQSPEELPWSWRLSLMLDILQGLSYLHHKGVLHRDLKSLNVLIDDRGRGKLTDFGLSRIKTLSTSLGTQSKHAVGTLRWMAPELLDDEHEPVYSNASDVYGAGIVIWELTSRQIPYEKLATDAQVIRWVVDKDKRETIPPECINEHREIADLIESSWKKEPAARPKAAEVVARLLALKNDGRYQARFFQPAPAMAAAPESSGFQLPEFQMSKPH